MIIIDRWHSAPHKMGTNNNFNSLRLEESTIISKTCINVILRNWQYQFWGYSFIILNTLTIITFNQIKVSHPRVFLHQRFWSSQLRNLRVNKTPRSQPSLTHESTNRKKLRASSPQKFALRGEDSVRISCVSRCEREGLSMKSDLKCYLVQMASFHIMFMLRTISTLQHKSYV